MVDGVTSDFLMARDETFGPVAPVMTFKDIDECLRIANETAVRAAGRGVHEQSAHRVPARRGHRVRHRAHQRDQQLLGPALAVRWGKKSGLGRELSDWCFDELTEVKQLNIDISKVK